ncbi:right-handed parallel beta-helix repeat-containing protein [Cellulomonas sp. P5_C5]
MRARVLLTVTAVLAALVVPTSASAGPVAVTCDTTLLVSTALTQDLTCPGPGLRLAPGVTLNLKGHTLTGTPGNVGIEVDAAGANVIINGTLTGWGLGVDTYNYPEDLTGEGTLKVDRVAFRDMRVGIDTSGESTTGRFPKTTTISRSTFTGNDIGITQAWFRCNLTVVRTTFADNVVGVWVDEACATITDSDFLRNTAGLRVNSGTATVERSRFVDNTNGMRTLDIGSIDATDIKITGGEVGISLFDNAGVTLRSSVVTGADIGVLLQRGAPATLDGNTFRSNGVAIVQLDDAYGGVIITNNTLRLNGEGIVTLPPVAPEYVQVGGNDVRRSTGWGIYAPGALDLGGNVARNNGSEPQCVGVVCSPGS